MQSTRRAPYRSPRSRSTVRARALPPRNDGAARLFLAGVLLLTLLLLCGWTMNVFAEAPAAPVAEGAVATETTETSVYGDGVSLEESTPVATLLSDPAAWEGRTVRVEGEVTEVCPRKGCWMSLRDGEAAVRIKVEDDVIVFPASAQGARAAAQGTVQVLEMDRQRYVSWLAHLAEEKGESFDESTVGEGPYRIVQIQGSGAEISG